MIGTSELINKFKKLKNKKYRYAYLKEHIRVGIASQIRILRCKANMTQLQLAEKVGTKQGVISRLEDPDSGSVNLNTLLKIAEALNVSLMVKFVSFGKFLEESKDISPEALSVVDYNDEYGRLEIVTRLRDSISENISARIVNFRDVTSLAINEVSESGQFSSFVTDDYTSALFGGGYSHMFSRREVVPAKNPLVIVAGN